jgi:hypothetical protein
MFVMVVKMVMMMMVVVVVQVEFVKTSFEAKTPFDL